VDAQGNVVRLLDLRQGTADLTYLPSTKTILIPMMWTTRSLPTNWSRASKFLWIGLRIGGRAA
jgi:hypothetical protein